MDLQAFVDGFQTMTSVISVEKTSDGSYGEIRIAAGNTRFIDMLKMTSAEKEFVADSIYDRYIPKDMNFEDLCYRSAVLKQPIHTYVHINKPDLWFNVFALPIDLEQDGKCYCTYSVEQSELADIDLLSSHSIKISTDVLRTCIKLHGTDDFEKTVKEIIRDIRIICDAAVCTIMLVDFETGSCSILATDIKANSTLKRVTQFSNFYDIAVSWIDTIGDRECLIIKNEKDMKYISEVNNPWYLTLEEANVDSVVMFPLRYNGEVLGYIWATNFDTKNTMRIKETLDLTTFFLSSEIASYMMVKRLEHISYTDLLTGVKNRNAMNNRVSSIVSGEESISDAFGIVFADLNGLKRVNDSNGHYAGDLLLKKAAILLQELFGNDDIYRAGGDEFMIIVSGCDRAEFESKVNALKKSAGDPDNVCFAVGSYFDDQGCDIRNAMHQADEDMYRDKDEYYRIHPERKYR